GGVISSGATDELIQLSENLQIPVATAFRRFSAFPNTHQNYIGYLGIGAPEYLLNYIKESDLVLALGTRFSQMTTNDYELLTNESQLIHVDISESTFGKVYTPTLPIVSDIKEFVSELNQIVSEDESKDKASNLSCLRTEYEQFSTPKLVDRNDYADMNSVIASLNNELPKDSIITSDAGNFFSWLSRYYKYDKSSKYIGPTSGAMGYGMPAAIGAKIAQPDKVVVSLSGDGGYMMTMQEFETAVRNNIQIISIIINNNIYGTIRNHQERKYPGRVVGTSLSNPNFQELATSFGGHGERVSNAEEFLTAIKRALEAHKPTLIEVLTDPNVLSASAKQS